MTVQELIDKLSELPEAERNLDAAESLMEIRVTITREEIEGMILAEIAKVHGLTIMPNTFRPIYEGDFEDREFSGYTAVLIPAKESAA